MTKLKELFFFTCREIIRSNVYGFILLFAIMLTASSNLFANLTSQEQVKFLKDIGFASITSFSLILSVLLGSYQVNQDIENKNLYAVFTNPVSIYDYLLGRYFGSCAMIMLAVLIMAFVFFLNLFFQVVRFNIVNETLQMDWLQLAALSADKGIIENLALWRVFIAISLQCMIINIISMMFSVIFSQSIAVIGTIFVFIFGHISEFITQMVFQRSEVLGYLINLLFIGLPNFENYNISDNATLGHIVSNQYMFWLVLYSIVFMVVYILITHEVIKKKISDF